MNIESKYGLLLTSDIKIQRTYFKEMTRLLGVNVIYRSLKEGKKWTTYGEVDANYNEPTLISCIFDEHPTQQTLKKMGWVSELQQSSSLIHIPYDTPDIQVGCLFLIPSGIDNAQARLFRCVSLSNIMVYPASITCEILPEYETTYDNTLNNFEKSSFNLLNEEEDYM